LRRLRKMKAKTDVTALPQGDRGEVAVDGSLHLIVFGDAQPKKKPRKVQCDDLLRKEASDLISPVRNAKGENRGKKKKKKRGTVNRVRKEKARRAGPSKS